MIIVFITDLFKKRVGKNNPIGLILFALLLVVKIPKNGRIQKRSKRGTASLVVRDPFQRLNSQFSRQSNWTCVSLWSLQRQFFSLVWLFCGSAYGLIPVGYAVAPATGRAKGVVSLPPQLFSGWYKTPYKRPSLHYTSLAKCDCVDADPPPFVRFLSVLFPSLTNGRQKRLTAACAIGKKCIYPRVPANHVIVIFRWQF